MDVRALECFVAVAEELHFHRASNRLNLTQPALSQRIRALETQLGVALFDRDRRRVSITAAGAAALDPARAAVANAMRFKALAIAASQGKAGRLRLGFTVIAFYGGLPRAVRRFRERYPDVAVELAEMNSPRVESALLAGEIDLGILHPPLEHSELMRRDLPGERMTLAVPEGHRLVAHDRIAIADLADEPLLAAPRAVGPAFYDRLAAFFREAGIQPRIHQEVTPMTTLTGLVAAGAGVGLVTRGIAEAGRPGVVFRAVEPEPPPLPLAAAWTPPAPTPAATRFLAVVAAETEQT